MREGNGAPSHQTQGMGVFERYLTLWVLLCIVAGIGLGRLAPGLAAALDGISVYQVSIPIAVCLVCSIVVSSAAVLLQPLRLYNQELDRKQNILRAAGFLPSDAKVDAQGRGIDELFAEFEIRAVDLNTGEFVEGVDLTSYNPIKAAKKSDESMELSNNQDIAVIGRRENVSLVYLKYADGQFTRTRAACALDSVDRSTSRLRAWSRCCEWASRKFPFQWQ